jgi:arylsulfatase A-like enzyme
MKRSLCIGRKLFLWGAMGWLLPAMLSCSGPKQDLPNIICIVADDLGWKDVGFMGSGYYETPHLDRLAGEGMVFNQAYAAAANCAPSRACLMTGRYTPAHGIYTVASSERGDARTRKIVPAKNTTVLRNEFHTLAEALQEAGYTTASLGKWHLGDDPCSQGFDLNVAGSLRGHPRSYFAPYGGPELEAPAGEYLTDRLTREALKFMRQNKRQPYFLYLPYYAVHTPIQPKDSLEQKYREKGGTGCQSNAAYAAMVDNMDRCIGWLLEDLERTGRRANTLVIFTSDNGGIREISCQDPLRAGKGSYYEGGIRIPLVFSWPGRIEDGVRQDEPVIHVDLYPTLMELTGAKPPADLDGLSLWPLLSGKGKLPERALYFHFPVYLQAYRAGYDDGRDPLFRTRPGSVIRKGGWKLHYYYEDGGVELYDLQTDPGERNNLAAIETGRREELLSLLRKWLEQEGAPVDFAPNPDFDETYLLGLEAPYN